MSILKTVRKYGQGPFQIGLLHGGPGASGEMKPVAEALSHRFGILELLQTQSSVDGLIKELHEQLSAWSTLPTLLIGHSWGAWLGFLFASKFPNRVKKLILISSGAFESKYSKDLMHTRLNRLSPKDRKEAERIFSSIHSGNPDNTTLNRFGRLMEQADAFDYMPDNNEPVDFNMQIFQSVWTEANRLRETHALLHCAALIKCPVVAIHGEYDPHPIEGVEIPLSHKLKDFKMIKIEKCGHTPWKERQAKDTFFEILQQEIYLGIT